MPLNDKGQQERKHIIQRDGRLHNIINWLTASQTATKTPNCETNHGAFFLLAKHSTSSPVYHASFLLSNTHWFYTLPNGNLLTPPSKRLQLEQ